VGRVGKRNRSKYIQLSFYCSLDRAAGSFTYNIQNKQSSAFSHRSSTDASLVLNEPVK
jgi:hypothetical protein